MLAKQFFLLLAVFPAIDFTELDLSGIADTLEQHSENKKLESIHEKIMEKPDDLIDKDEAKEGLETLKALKAKDVTFERLQGFDGIEDYEPSGWKIEATPERVENEPEGENEMASTWPMGVGMALMNGCFGNNYQIGDPCYDFARNSPICLNQIDAANFLGVGFDGRGFYSSESRKKSIIQRTCAGKANFMDKDVPDCMNAFGIYDYTIRTETFQDAGKYIHYLQEKAATSEQQAMFQMEAKSFGQGSSFGGDLGMIGSLAGMAGGAAAGSQAGGTEGAKAGAEAGAKLGAAIGQSISFGKGQGSGFSNGRNKGSRKANIESLNSESKTVGSATHMIAILEADLKLFEIVLDEIKPSDLSINFLHDFLNLPSSYWSAGGNIKFQNFILRWGTHFVKSAKFGGELRILKTSKMESKMKSDEFASQAQSEFAGMMGILKSSYKQSQENYGFLGIGESKTKTSQSSRGRQKQKVSSKINQQGNGSQQNKKSEFIKTKIEAKGGNPEIAAAITDFYTPRFRQLFVDWLNSIDEYQRPFEFTLGKISSIFNMNMNSLFSSSAPASGCFKDKDLKVDSNTGLSFFEYTQTRQDDQNKTVMVKRKNTCKYGKSKEKLMEDFKKTRLALERAENIYMAEGPFSTTNFDIPGGKAGCESETVEFIGNGDTTVKSWPSWNELKSNTYKVVFYMRHNLLGISKNSEFIIKFANNLWFTKYFGSKFSLENSCPSSTEKYRVCIAQMPMIYDEKTGYLYLDSDKNDYTLSWLNYPLASVRVTDPVYLLTHSIGAVGFVPCTIKWSNTHQVPLDKKGSCIYFHAASSGSIYLVFSGVPEEYSTWFYIQMTPLGIIFYQGMKVVKSQHSKLAVTSGKETLFTGFFVCISVTKEGLRIDYGKAPEESEVGIVLSSHTFSDFIKYDMVYFTFGSGERKISINDVRVVKEKPILTCGEGFTLVNGVCKLICHKQCIGCNQANDPSFCIRCKSKKIFLKKKEFICIEKCPSGFNVIGNLCQCKMGEPTKKNTKLQCRSCSKGSSLVDGFCQEDNKGPSKCIINPCQNGGRCFSDGIKFTCKCFSPYIGKLCQETPCDSNPCKNGGTCINSKSGYSCLCRLMYTGKHCEVKTFCKKSSCYNGGECLDLDQGYICNCKAGYFKKYCEKAKNVALGQQVTVSSIYRKYEPKKVTDGRYYPNKYFATYRCFVTNKEKAWIKVLLDRKYNVGKVRIYNRQDDADNWARLFPFHVEVLDGEKVHICGESRIEKTSYTPLVGPVDVDCGSNGIVGDSVKIVKNDVNFINICEVEVYPLEEKVRECYRDKNGNDYRGSVSTSINGRKCINWERNSDNERFTPSKSPFEGLEGNQCRNPNKRPSGLWCYVDREVWDECHIERCSVENVALGQSVTSSSYSSLYKPEKITDGLYYKSYFDSFRCFTTNRAKKAWIKVSLGRKYKVAKVKIYNRSNKKSHWERLFPFHIEVLDGEKVHICGASRIEKTSYTPLVVLVDIDCGSNGIVGDSVKIVKDDIGLINICEVEVYPLEE